MFLSTIIGKPVVANKQTRGFCLGVGISLKTHAVKYLLCSSTSPQGHADFAVSVSSIVEIENAVTLARLRAVHPKNCARIFLQRPIYSYDGALLGKVLDLEIRELTAVRLFSDRGQLFPVQNLLACSDAVLLKKELPYPLGQRIPVFMLARLSEKDSPIVTKPLLRTAIAKGDLIKLTLSLAPFRMEFYP